MPIELVGPEFEHALHWGCYGGEVQPSEPTRTWSGRAIAIALVIAILAVTLPIIILVFTAKPVHSSGSIVQQSISIVGR